MFSEAFGLRQVYVPLRAYYRQKVESENEPRGRRSGRYANEFGTDRYQRVVVELAETLESWLQEANPNDAIRVISGGPGSGKSSFVKMFAAQQADKGMVPVLFVPLHQFDPEGDLETAVGKFVSYDELLKTNPLDRDNSVDRLLIIFDGLDELAMQGKIAREVAQNFVREVQSKVARFNQRGTRLQVILSGRELVVQGNSSEFRKPQQVLHLTPHFLPEDKREQENNERYVNAEQLAEDRRQIWWRCYGVASGKDYASMPAELDQGNLVEITAQPLLNYLVALSYGRDGATFGEDTNLNQVYQSLLDAVYERGYEANRPHQAIKDIRQRDFILILEEIALAAWHGDGRTTTVKEIEQHCENSGLEQLLKNFEEGAEAGVTHLLTAFYFRQSGGLRGNERTFEFTHKSFGEYLTARRIVRAIAKIQRELDDREKMPTEGWGKQEGLVEWAKVCGATEIDSYLYRFLLDEVKLQPLEDVKHWQVTLSILIGFMLRHSMPMESLRLSTFHQANQQSKNAEVALLAALSSCAWCTQTLSNIDWPSVDAFGDWLCRLYGQRKQQSENAGALNYLNHLNLNDCNLFCADLAGARLIRARLDGASLDGARLDGAILVRASLVGASLVGASLVRTRLGGARLNDANLDDVNLVRASLVRANLDGTSLVRANLDSANLKSVSLDDANLVRARLSNISWDEKTNWTNTQGLETAINVPRVLEKHLGLI
ncbi:MAG: pentapeptide repeat-containing protein [Cyanobacteria bacterium P01_D01_bin.14]